jgi:hypothetical protein
MKERKAQVQAAEASHRSHFALRREGDTLTNAEPIRQDVTTSLHDDDRW